MAQPADQFRRSDVVLWGSVAVVASALALVAANLAAIEPQDALAALHNSRAVAAQQSELTNELVALDSSKSTLLKLADTERQLQATRQQLAASRQQLLAAQGQIQKGQQQAGQAADTLGNRLTALERTVAENGTQLSALAEATPRKVNALKFAGADPTTITGAIDTPAAGFTAAAAQPAAPQAMPAALPAPAAARREAQPEVVGPKWTQIASLPTFASPVTPAATDASAPPAEAVPAEAATATAAPYPMAPRPAALDRPASAPLALEPGATDGSTAVASAAVPASLNAGAIGAPPARRPKADVRAIGVAIGNPVTPASALASWQQIAGHVGVLLVGTSPLLADDPAGSVGKVLVAGPIPSIAAATALCGKIEQAALSCTPMPYVGATLGGQ